MHKIVILGGAIMLDYKEKWQKTLKTVIPTYFLSYENHKNFNDAHRCTSMSSLETFCNIQKLNLLGFAEPPYNPYGAEYNLAVVFEEIENDYRIVWHHCSKTWFNMLENSAK